MKIIFLDVDGCINTGEKYSNGYNKIDPVLMERLNKLLLSVPESKIVLISAWRYLVGSDNLDGSKSDVEGLENLLLSHGMECYKRLHGYTCSDEKIADEMGFPRMSFETLEIWYKWIKEYGITIRRMQIHRYISENPEITDYVIIDNIDLNIDNQIVVDDSKGLTEQNIIDAALILKEEINNVAAVC